MNDQVPSNGKWFELFLGEKQTLRVQLVSLGWCYGLEDVKMRAEALGYLLVGIYAREPLRAKFPNQEEETGLIIFGGSQWMNSNYGAVVGHLHGGRHIKGRWYSGFVCCMVEFARDHRWLVADVADRELLSTLSASSGDEISEAFDKRRGHDRRKPERGPFDEVLETIQRGLEMK